VLDLLREPRFADLAPAEVYATLLDEGVYHCSIRTLYRILDDHAEVRERRDQLSHPVYSKPELLAEGPDQVWSWDITKLMGPVKWSYFYLYVILDIFSRRVVGWCVADAESAALFKVLFDDTFAKHAVPPGQLTLHADRGGPMKAKATALMLADLGVTKSHSRPHTSNDNPFSDFKTLKYQPEFPERFGCVEIPARIPRTLRLRRGRQGLLPPLLRLVQPGPPPCRSWPDDARSSPLRPSRRHPCRPTADPRSRFQHQP
jgi:putative transposase